MFGLADVRIQNQGGDVLLTNIQAHVIAHFIEKSQHFPLRFVDNISSSNKWVKDM